MLRTPFEQPLTFYRVMPDCALPSPFLKGVRKAKLSLGKALPLLLLGLLIGSCATTGSPVVSPYEELTVEEKQIFQTALSLLHQDRLEESRLAFVELLKKNPINVSAHLHYQDLMIALDLMEEVLQKYSLILQEREDAMSIMLHARLLDNPEDRLHRYEEALGKDPDFHWAAFALGHHYQDQGERRKARDWFEKSVSIFPCFPDGLLALARIYYRREKWKESEEFYRRYIECNVQDANAHYELGLLWVERKDYNRAKRELRKALSLKPDDPWILVNLGNVLREVQEPEEALHCYEMAIVKAPRDPEPYLNLGILCEEEDEVRDLSRAVKMYNKYLELGGKERVKVELWIEQLEKGKE